MRTSIGLPNWLAGTPGPALLEWAARTEELGLDGVCTIGRTVFDSHEDLVTLAACAGATRRISLTTCVTVSPARDTALLGKQAATLDAISGGRFTLGLGVGWRPDDYAATGTADRFGHRGRVLDDQLVELRSMWSGSHAAPGPTTSERIGPATTRDGGPDVLIGGFAPAALARAGRLADGWIAVGMPPAAITHCFAEVERARADAGRPGRARLVACDYVACGEDVVDECDRNVERYYRFGGDSLVQVVRSGVLRTASAIRSARAELASIGVDEHVLVSTVAGTDQLERIVDAL